MANIRPATPLGTWDQIFSNQFYTWEKRGRGWKVWDFPVELEPLFYPFYFYAQNTQGVIDDGQRPTLASRLAGSIFKSLSGKNQSTSEPAQLGHWADMADAEPDFFATDSPLCEFQLALPPTFKSSKDQCEQFLLSVAQAELPLSFEIIGLADEIVIQIVCHAEDSGGIREELAAFFPEAVVMEETGFLLKHWSPASNSTDELCQAGLVVDFGLEEEFLLPLRTGRGFDPDPLIGIVGALAALEEQEIGIFQVLFNPVRHAWAENVLQTVLDPENKSFFGTSPNLVTQAKAKISAPLYAAIIRVAARAQDHERMWQIVRGLAGSLSAFNNPSSGNKLVPLTNEGYADKDHIFALLARLTYRGGMLLNSDELLSLIHPPSASVRSSRLRREVSKTKPAPALAIGHELVLGENVHNGRTIEVSLPDKERLRHMHVIGTPGTGKSTFLLNMILQDIEHGKGLAVLDPHGDLIDDILGRIPESRWKDVVLVDISDSEYPVGFNILSAHSELEKELLSSDLTAVFQRLSTSWGDVMTSVLNNAIQAFLESERGGTLSDLKRFLIEKEFRDEFLTTVKDPAVIYFWRREFPMMSGKPQSSILTRLNIFLERKRLRNMVSQKENRLDFAGMMNEGKIFLAKLAQGAIGVENAYLLGSLFVSKFHQIALSRQEIEESERRDFMLYIDEFQNFVTPSLSAILTGARKYHLGLVLAHHQMGQLARVSEVDDAVLANPYARICFHVGDDDARKMAEGFSFFEAKDLQNLAEREAICRFEQAAFDFNLRTITLAPIDKALAAQNKAAIVNLSRQRYAIHREVVEAALAKDAPDYSLDVEPEKPRQKTKREQPSLQKAKPQVSEAPVNTCPLQAEPQMDAAPPSPVPPPLPLVVAEPVTQNDLKPAISPAIQTKATPAKHILPGRGGPEHRAFQRFIKQLAQNFDWTGDAEHHTPEGGFIDVLLTKKGSPRIACEVSITTPEDKEVGNIQKCLKAQCDPIVLISGEAKHQEKIRTLAQTKLSAKDFSKLRFLLTREDFVFFFETINAQFATVEKRTHGYIMKKTYTAVEADAKKVMEDGIISSIADTMQETLRKAKNEDNKDMKSDKKEGKEKGKRKGADQP